LKEFDCVADEEPRKSRSERQAWMSVLARASRAELEAYAATLDVPRHELVKGPETGIAMIEGRAGGTGRRFNLGEATLTRAVVRMPDGTLGFSYALGRDRRKAELAAVMDALLQDAAWTARIMQELVTPLAEMQAMARQTASRQAAATKVDFFTLQRGDG